jgi:hypothetical protein
MVKVFFYNFCSPNKETFNNGILKFTKAFCKGFDYFGVYSPFSNFVTAKEIWMNFRSLRQHLLFHKKICAESLWATPCVNNNKQLYLEVEMVPSVTVLGGLPLKMEH